MFINIFLFTLINCNIIHAFKKCKNYIIDHNFKLKSSNDDYFKDVNIIHNFKGFFQSENYNDVVNDVTNNKISRILINSNYKEVISVDNIPSEDLYLYNHYHISNIDPVVLPNLVQKTSEYHVPIYFVNFSPENVINIKSILNELFTVTSYVIPVFFLISIISSISNMRSFTRQNKMGQRVKGQKGQKFNNPFGIPDFNGDDKYVKPNVSLTSWAGSPEVIEECYEVISYIENKEKYKLIGAEMPKGILLEGPPGTGKTLLAKAIATETNSSFISMSGSEFVELFVGMGASRVRDLFDSARENRPCIIFIDEIDAVARQRGTGINMANDEREQTLNQLLYEMDGFNDNEDIVVMAATNRKDVLDQALLRPGRFDRIIKVPLPDKDSRIKILNFYLQSKNIFNFDVSSIAELTDGFSGAQLKNLINEAAILSARNNFTIIQEKYIFDSFEKLIVGLIKQNATINESTKIRVAIHESGHSILALKFKEYFDFKKASIQPTYNGAGGYTIFTEKPQIKEGGLYTKDMLKKRLIVSMGGKAAESIYYGNDFVSLGSFEDLKQANNLAKRMIGNFGMGEKMEVFFNEDIGDESNPFVGRSIALGDKYSEYTKFIMDKESLDLVKEAYNEAKQILTDNFETLWSFSKLLQDKTVVYDKDIDYNII